MTMVVQVNMSVLDSAGKKFQDLLEKETNQNVQPHFGGISCTGKKLRNNMDDGNREKI